MNRDRGTIKWNALMLPEHVKLLREWQAEDSRNEKPQLEKWQIEEMNENLYRAMEQHATVIAEVWLEGELRKIVSKIVRYNPVNNKLFFSSGEIVPIQNVFYVEVENSEPF
jgi:hypothetical protein